MTVLSASHQLSLPSPPQKKIPTHKRITLGMSGHAPWHILRIMIQNAYLIGKSKQESDKVQIPRYKCDFLHERSIFPHDKRNFPHTRGIFHHNNRNFPHERSIFHHDDRDFHHGRSNFPQEDCSVEIFKREKCLFYK